MNKFVCNACILKIWCSANSQGQKPTSSHSYHHLTNKITTSELSCSLLQLSDSSSITTICNTCASTSTSRPSFGTAVLPAKLKTSKNYEYCIEQGEHENVRSRRVFFIKLWAPHQPLYRHFRPPCRCPSLASQGPGSLRPLRRRNRPPHVTSLSPTRSD